VVVVQRESLDVRDGQFEVLGELELDAAQFGVLPLDLLELAGAVVRPLACGR
jgi:hypothetical protein